MSLESNAKYRGSALISSLRCSGVLQGALTAEAAPAPCSGILVRQDYCANIISRDAIICFLLLRCVLCCYMNWWRGKVELQLSSLGIICVFWSTTLQQSEPLYMWLCRLLLCPSTCFSSTAHRQTLVFFKNNQWFYFSFIFLFSWGFVFVHSVHFFTSNTANWHLCCVVPFLLKIAVQAKQIQNYFFVSFDHSHKTILPFPQCTYTDIYFMH